MCDSNGYSIYWLASASLLALITEHRAQLVGIPTDPVRILHCRNVFSMSLYVLLYSWFMVVKGILIYSGIYHHNYSGKYPYIGENTLIYDGKYTDIPV